MKRAAASSILVSVMLLAVAVMTEAQQPTKIPMIGFLSEGFPSSDSDSTGIEGISNRSA
jgi:hypothetical protein